MVELEEILQVVCKKLSVSQKDLKSKRRFRKLVIARSIYCLLSRKYTKYVLEGIGLLINRHHSSVIHLSNSLTSQLDLGHDKDVINKFTQVEKQIIHNGYASKKANLLMQINNEIEELHQIKRRIETSKEGAHLSLRKSLHR